MESVAFAYCPFGSDTVSVAVTVTVQVPAPLKVKMWVEPEMEQVAPPVPVAEYVIVGAPKAEAAGSVSGDCEGLIERVGDQVIV